MKNNFEIKTPRKTIQLQVKPRSERNVVYFCRLCRKYGIGLRLSHLEHYHNTTSDLVKKRENKDLLEIIFLESKN